MPANQKAITEIKREKFNSFRQALRDKGWAIPYSDSGPIRATNLFVDVNYDEPTRTVAFRIREVPEGYTYDSVFNQIETIFKSISS